MVDPKPPETLAEGSVPRPAGAEGRDTAITRYHPGEHIAGRYEVIDVVGEGATAVVYRVFDHSSEEEIAVKIIDDVEGGIDKLRHEVRLARRVTHANVCRVFDIVEHRHGALLSMELASGTLLDRVGTPHDDDSVRAMAAQILDGLEAAHAAGIVHRDLKPANVLVGEGDVLKVTDFGVAHRAVDVLATEEGHGAGTPAYMAPEQLEGEAVDARTDLYAVGLILYELSAGRLPFVRAHEPITLAAAFKRVERDIPPLPGSSLDGAIRRMVSRDPGRRPASAAEARALLGLVTSPTRSRSRSRSRWLVAAVAIAAFAVVASVVVQSRRSARTVVTVQPLVQPKTRALTGAEEQIADRVAFTRDGKALIVATDRSHSWQLWHVSTDRAMQRPLTNGALAARAPQIVGDYLYYRLGSNLVRVQHSRIGTKPWGDDAAEIVARDIRHYHVSKTGRIVVVKLNTPRKLELLADGKREPGRVLATATLPIGVPQWSPDETRIAWGDRPWGDPSASAIHMVDRAGGMPVTLAPASGFTGLAWLPDGRRIVFVSGVGDSRALQRLHVATKRVVALVHGLRDAALPSVGPDGRLAYLVDTWSYALWLYDKGRLRRTTFLGDEAVVSPHWVHGRDELIYGVSRLDRSGLEMRRLTGPTFTAVAAVKTISATHSSLAVSADGGTIVFTVRDSKEFVIRRASMSGDGPEIELHRSSEQLLALQFIGGDRVSYFEAATGSVWDMKIDGSDRRKLTRGGGGFHSYDGKWIVFSGSGSPTGVWLQRKGADGLLIGKPIAAPGTELITNTRWHPRTNELVTIEAAGLFSIDPRTRRRRLLARWPAGAREPDKIAVHPDGRIACSIAMGRSSVKLIDNFAAMAK